MMRTLWSTDFGDGSSVLDQPHSREDRAMLKLLDNSITVNQGRYQLPLPWRSDTTQLPNNKEMVLRRLLSLKRRLSKDSELKEKYSSTMQEYLTNNYAAEMRNCKEVEDLVWYLPHHPVMHPLKPNKVRVVFDCGAKYKGVSLNDSLMSGPCLTSNLVGVLTRFRKE